MTYYNAHIVAWYAYHDAMREASRIARYTLAVS